MDNSQNDVLETLEASIAFMPNVPENPRIAVSFQQRMSYEGSFIRKPILSVSALLPDHSEVFELIISGDLKGLRKVLTLRKAHLNDRDTKGRSLLNVSII